MTVEDAVVETLQFALATRRHQQLSVVRVTGPHASGKSTYVARLAAALKAVDPTRIPLVVACGDNEAISGALREFIMKSIRGIGSANIPVVDNWSERYMSLETDTLIIDNCEKMTPHQMGNFYSRLRANRHGRMVVLIGPVESQHSFISDIGSGIRENTPFLALQLGTGRSSLSSWHVPKSKEVKTDDNTRA